MSNPFIFQDRNVGTQGYFVQMLTESDAVIDNSSCLDTTRCEPVILSNVPPTAFVRGTSVAVIVKALGMRTLKAGTTDLNIPNFRVVAYELCDTSNNEICAIGNMHFDRLGVIGRR